MLQQLTRSPAVLGFTGALVGALLLGGIAVAGATGVGPFGATAQVDRGAPRGAPLGDLDRGGRGGRLQAILDKLVLNGTITADQRAKILQAIADEAKSFGHRGPRPEGFLGNLVEQAAKAIGISASDLRRELPGKSLAQVAQAHGVSRADLIAKLTSAIDTRIDKAVADGKLPADRAAQLKTRVADTVARLVDQARRGP